MKSKLSKLVEARGDGKPVALEKPAGDMAVDDVASVEEARAGEVRESEAGVMPEPVVRQHPSVETLGPMMKSLAKSMDVVDAVVVLREHCEAMYEAANARLPSLVFRAQEEQQYFETVKTQAAQVQQTLERTPPHIRAADGARKSPRVTDRVWLWVLGGGAVLAMILSVINMASALLSTYLPIFTDNLFITYALSCLMPLASLSVKLLPHSLDEHRHKIWMARGIYGLTLLVVLRWVYLMAHTYHGSGGGFEDTLNTDTASLIFTQLMMEVLIAGAMVLRITEITDTFAPLRLISNPDYQLLKDKLEELSQEQDNALKKLNETTTQINAMKAHKTVFVNEALAEFTLMQARHKALFD